MKAIFVIHQQIHITNLKTFEELGVVEEIRRAITEMGFEHPMPVQEEVIPYLLGEGNDVIALAQTGTGKTAAFGIPLLQKIDVNSKVTQAIILSPTRELCLQIADDLKDFARYMEGVRIVAVYGGTSIVNQINALNKGVQIIVATPGRLIDLMNRGVAHLDAVNNVVLDEADRMLDMGFSDDILSIAKLLPKEHQTIMFSATMPQKIQQLAHTLLTDPVEVKIAVSKPAEKIQQSAYVCYEPQKLGIIRHLFKAGELERVIIFSGKKDKVKDITRELKRMNINCAAMHSDLTQAERDEVMYQFKAGQVSVLVATDIVARGIDIDDILCVINYDVPRDAEDYVHRIGRTARAQRDGVAITLVNEADMRYFSDIERFLERDILKNPLPEGLGEGPAYQPSAPRKSSRGHGGRKRGGSGKPRQHGGDKQSKGGRRKHRGGHKPKTNSGNSNA